MKSTKEVLEHHQKALKQGDINGVMSDYAPGAVLFTKDGILRGSEAIRHMFETFIAEFAKPGTTLNRKQQLVDGDYAYAVDGRDCAQCLRDGHRHICREGR